MVFEIDFLQTERHNIVQLASGQRPGHGAGGLGFFPGPGDQHQQAAGPYQAADFFQGFAWIVVGSVLLLLFLWLIVKEYEFIK